MRKRSTTTKHFPQVEVEPAFQLALPEIERGFVTHTRHFEFYHRVFVSKFPYNLYYRLAGEKAVIVGLLYARFDPEKIKQTLRNRGGKE